MRKILITILVMTLVGILAGGTCIAGVPASISYQGKLTNSSGQPVSDDDYQVQFKLYTGFAETPFWTSAPQSVTTSGGVFTTQLAPLTASDLAGLTDVWMEIWVGSPLVALSPMTKFTSVPYALISGDSWSLLGNAGTSPGTISGTNFLGTTDNQPLEFKVYNTRALRLEPTSGAPNVIGGYSGNTVTAGALGATISGGGSSIHPNSVTSEYGTVGGGYGNTAGGADTPGRAGTVGGGHGNTASGAYATVAGGLSNTALGADSFAAGQRANAIHDGTFVWSDSTTLYPAFFASTAANQFLIRAVGGVGIGTNSPTNALSVAGKMDVTGNVGIGTNNPAAALDVNGLIRSRTGGFKFPDNTIQTTAASAASSWGLTGNAGTIPGINFIGTTDDQPMEFRVHNARGFRLEPTSGAPNVIGGYTGNTVTAGFAGATISGGGESAKPNSVTNDFGTVGGGTLNTAGYYGTVGGGIGNTAISYATVGGGSYNNASSFTSTVGGGSNNTASGSLATVGGGYGNTAPGDEATVPGGRSNTASGDWGTVAGGSNNTASGNYATVGGGNYNTALGVYSFAAGQRAKANHQGAFVWADSVAADFTSTAANQFLFRASGGVGVGTNSPTNALSVAGNVDVTGHVGIGTATLDCPLNFANTLGDKISLYGSPNGGSYGFGIQGSVLQIHTSGRDEDVAFGHGSSGSMSETMRIKGNGTVGIGTDNPDPGFKLDVRGDAIANSFWTHSDLRYKTNIATIGDALDKVMKLRGINFDWKKSEYPELAFGDGRQVGFVAQEIEQVLPEAVTKDAKGFYSAAYDSVVPVLVEAIKEQQKTIDELRAKTAEIDDLKKLVAALVSREQEKP